MSEIRKLATDNPILDEIIYQCQTMIAGLVMKDQKRASDNETRASQKEADKYKMVRDDEDFYEYYKISYDSLLSMPSLSIEDAAKMAKNNNLIPTALRPQLHKIEREKFLSTYQERNNYYRMLNGQPDIGDDPIRLTREQCIKLNLVDFDYSKSVDEMDPNEIDLLRDRGILDELKKMYPDKEYLKHLGDAKVDPYIARKAPPFSVLYMPSCDSMEVYRKFSERLMINRDYVIQTLYTDAYKLGSDYYDNFIMMVIIIQAFSDMIVSSPEYIITRELFDLRTIQLFFEASGVTYFPEIPIKHQKKLVKNLNRLIKYSSSDKNFMDIAALFGFENIQLFKYYMLRQPIIGDNGQYNQATKIDPETREEVDDTDANYTLKFVKVPIGGNIDDYMRDDMNYIDYDDVVEKDRYWDGVYEHGEVQSTIKSHEFNYVVTKYIAIDTLYEVADMTFDVVYFINMLLYSGLDLSKITLQLPELNSTMRFELTDLFIALYALKYTYYGIKDNIIYSPVNILDIKGFNFQANLERLEEYANERGYTLEELGVADFVIPENNEVTSFEQLMEIYTKNSSVYEHIVQQIDEARDKDIYDIYMEIYEALMIGKLNFKLFRDGGSGSLARTYTEFLSNKSGYLYNKIMDCQVIGQDSERQKQAAELINIIIDNLYIYINSDEFRYVFQGIPTASLDYVKQYMFNVLNFFKSYKVDFVSSNDVYSFKDPLENRVHILDKVFISTHTTFKEEVPYEDYISYVLHHRFISGLDMYDDVYFIKKQ